MRDAIFSLAYMVLGCVFMIGWLVGLAQGADQSLVLANFAASIALFALSRGTLR